MGGMAFYPSPLLAMKALIPTLLGFAALSAGAAFGADVKLRVEGSQELRLVIVDSIRASAGRDTLHRAFADGLAEAINRSGGAPIAVGTKRSHADQAAFSLNQGVCDAVLVIGKDVPRPLIIAGTRRLVATLTTNRGEKKAYLIFSDGDPGLTRVLSDAFTPAITDHRFLDAMDGGFDQVDADHAGTKLAAR